jgi:uncharacterized protein (DUF1697 family)
MPSTQWRTENKARSTGRTSYVAFLRGINVGGNRKVKMAALAEAFSSLGFRNVRTLLASGNVLFETRATDTRALAKSIERRIKRALGLEASVILRTRRALQQLLEADPFKGIPVSPNTRLFVTFLSEKPRTALKIPYQSPEKSFRILRLSGRDVCSVLVLGPQWSRNLRQMDILEKEFGKKITTRTWNSVQRCVQS